MSDYRHPADRPEVVPFMPAEEVMARMGCDPEAIDAQVAAEGLARSLVVALSNDDLEAIDVVLDGYIDECQDPADALIRALLAAARLASDVTSIAAHALRIRPGKLLFGEAEHRRAGHEVMRAAVDALIDDTPAEALDPEVDATRASLRRDAYLHAVTEGVAIDAAERFDLELRALLDAADEVAPDDGSGH